MAKIRIPGESVKAEPDAALKKFFDVRVLHSHEVKATTRGGPAVKPTEVEVSDDALVAVEYANGLKLWLCADVYEREGTRPAAAARGKDADVLVKSVNVIQLSPAEALGEAAGKLGAMAVVKSFEKKLEPGPGLYRMTDAFTTGAAVKAAGDLKSKDKILLFLHGTASNTTGSFSGMALASGQSDLSILRNTTPEWDRLRSEYADQILGFEHPTLSLSPIDNALELISRLPGGATVHLVSHSRGGLVGELVCLSQELTDEQLKPMRDRGDAYLKQADDLKKLSRLLADKKLNIERFVRVACPARGTILASKRLDLYLSVILNAVGLIPGLTANPFFEFFKASALELIRQRTEAGEVPGIEAMMPESPLIHLLNQRGVQSQADLAVVSGDIKGEGLFDRLKKFAVDLYYLTRNDLVVDTDSMYCGVGRKSVAHYVFDRGPDVNHFQYFKNHKTRDLVMNWLTAADVSGAGFKELTAANLEMDKAASRGGELEGADVVVFVPGFMGSHLSLKDSENRVWLDFDSLALGAAEGLAGELEPDGLVGAPYQALLDSLAGQFLVREFAYDWRLSAVTNAAELDKEIQTHLDASRRVHLLTHSTGCLVAQAIPAATWTKLRKGGGQLVMLGGVPKGTYAAVEMIAGRAAIVRQLGLLDYANRDRFPDLFASWDGVLEMLPEEFLAIDAWKNFDHAPDAGRLKAAADVRKTLDGRDGAIVTGAAARTACAADGKFDYTQAGDGRVLWSSLPKKNVWYIDAPHGELANWPLAFRAIGDLIEKGTTDRLLTVAPEIKIDSSPGLEPVLFPDEEELLDAALGGCQKRELVADAVTLKVSVLHSDVARAKYPVLVGHYRGDTIVSAERRLDALLDQALTQRFQAGIYPGPKGSSELIRAQGKVPPGVIIAGLGDVGQLTEDGLRATVRRAVLRYAMALADEPPAKEPAVPKWRSAAFSTLLIGTYGDQIDADGCVTAIVQAAVEANRALRAQNLWETVRVDAVQFVELYEDVATQTVHAVNHVTERLRIDLDSNEVIQPTATLRSGEGGLDKRPTDQYSGGWWRRIEITSEKDKFGDATLKFNVPTDRARSEETTRNTPTKRVQAIVQRAIHRTYYDEATSVTLYELLVPKHLKDEANELANVLLEVDEVSAQYPWEMLARRSDPQARLLSTTAGMIRQFKSTEFEEPRATRLNTALVAAFPKIGTDENRTEFPELTGASHEATEIRARLTTCGYAVSPDVPVVEDSSDLVTTLYTGDYRILHLAGHGVVNRNGKTGLMLSIDDVFTADDVKNLPTTPDLVFLNCCHLGQIGGDDDSAAAEESGRVNPEVNKLAASLAKAFIEIGCRAVVAAGWAVNDKAAVRFAQTFYTAMLEGETFGQAVLKARKLVRRDFPDTNTWGAYQCYGNPGYRLKLSGGSGAADPASPPRTRTEVLERVRDLPKQDGASESSADQLWETLPAEWKKDGQLLCAFGDTFGTFGNFERAVELYAQAVSDPGSKAPIRAIEKLANHQDRNAKALRRSAKERKDRTKELEEDAKKQLAEAIERLKWLMGTEGKDGKWSGLGPTVDRWSLLGGAYRRKSLFGEKVQNLRESAVCYGKADALYRLQNDGAIDPYPGLNWLVVRFLAAEKGKKLSKDLADIKKAAEEKAAARDDFWAETGVPNSLLVEALLQKKLAVKKDEIVKAYRDVLKRNLRNQVQFGSIRGLVSDLLELYKVEGECQALIYIDTALEKLTAPGK